MNQFGRCRGRACGHSLKIRIYGANINILKLVSHVVLVNLYVTNFDNLGRIVVAGRAGGELRVPGRCGRAAGGGRVRGGAAHPTSVLIRAVVAMVE